MIIALEGLDACGKNTQAKLINRYLNENWPNSSTLFSFPDYSSPTGKLILSLLKEEWQPSYKTRQDVEQVSMDRAYILQALMSQNRYEKYNVLKNAHRSDQRHVICDRYFASGLVYGQADGISLDYLRSIHDGLPSADLWILLDITAEESVKRRPVRRDEYERRAGFMEAVRDKYLQLFRNPPHDGMWIVIDGMKSTSEIFANLIDIISKLFEYKMSQSTGKQ